MKTNNKKNIKVSVDILISKTRNILFFDQKFLFGKLSQKWDTKGTGLYGLPGGEIKFGEKIDSAVKRMIRAELGCKTTWYRIFCVNVNYAFGNHYVVLGIYATISGTPKILKPKDWLSWEWHRKYFLDGDSKSNLFPSAEKTWDCAFNGKTNVCYSEQE